MQGLCLHAGGYAVDRSVIEKVQTPAAEGTWVPISHAGLLDRVEAALDTANLPVKRAEFALTKDGARMFGIFQVSNGNARSGMMIGVRNTHDKSFAASLCLGANVFVCDNLAFHGEVSLARRHTRFIERDLPGLVSRALGRLTEQRQLVGLREDAYLKKMIEDPRDASHLIIEMYRAGVYPTSKIGAVLDGWRAPQHEEFKAEANAWRLYNSVTEMWKGANPFDLPKRSDALHGILDPYCGLTIARPEDIIGDAVDAEFTEVKA